MSTASRNFLRHHFEMIVAMLLRPDEYTRHVHAHREAIA